MTSILNDGTPSNSPAGEGLDRTGPPVLPILAIETSTTVARVAVVDAKTGERLAAGEAASERHSSNLLRLCIETTDRARVTIAGLGAIACGAGPGSFTGLRVGFAVAKGLAMPTEIPLVLVSSLEALAIDMRGGIGPAAGSAAASAAASAAGSAAGSAAALAGALAVPTGWLLPCLDAGKGQVFAALFKAREGGGVTLVSDEWAVLPDLLAGQLPDDEMAVTCAGPGATRYWEILAEGLGRRGRLLEIDGPTAYAVATRALVKLACGEIADLDSAAPSYGRPPDITRPRHAVRAQPLGSE